MKIKDPENWDKAKAFFKTTFGSNPDLNGILYLIGIQELGSGVREFTKEEKQDLLHIANCKILSYSGYYELDGVDKEGWPHWKNLKTIPKFSIEEQEHFLKIHIIEYLEKEIGWV